MDDEQKGAAAARDFGGVGAQIVCEESARRYQQNDRTPGVVALAPGTKKAARMMAEAEAGDEASGASGAK